MARYRRRVWCTQTGIGLLFFLIWLAGTVLPVSAESGKLYFAAMVERDDGGQPQVVVNWGSLEGGIPTEIASFKLYRSANGGDHQLLATMNNSLVSVAEIENMATSDVDIRYDALLETLEQMGNAEEEPLVVDNDNFAGYLHQLLDPGSGDYDPLQEMLLGRGHLTAARARGLAYIDDTISATGTTYHYLLTAVTAEGESLPIGQSEATVNPAVETVLPAPTGLKQVYVRGCSPLGSGRDDNAIHLSWDIPASPRAMGIKALIYGYDLFWSEADNGPLNLRDGIPASLHRVNQYPVVASGPPPAEGPDSYLAKDGPENHSEGPVWQRGQQYYYYLAARDILGRYSSAAEATAMTVADAMPPRAVWNAHTLEVKDPANNAIPRLALVWDAPTPTNFARYYGGNRRICSSSATEICWVSADESCQQDTPRCADLDIAEYRIFRFDSSQGAAGWGLDSDNDLWPDEQEKDAGTDSCDSDDHPPGQPAELVAAILADESTLYRDLTQTHRQAYYIDYGIPKPDNHVYWYRIISVDQQGNQSPLSPPLRGVLYDRTQPIPYGSLSFQQCEYTIEASGDCSISPQGDDTFIVLDETGDAASYKLVQLCDSNSWQLVDQGEITGGYARIKEQNISLSGCKKSNGLVIRFYDADGKKLGETELFDVPDIQVFQGCYTEQKTCSWHTIGDPYYCPGSDDVRACVNLDAGESARFYYQSREGMSAFHSIDPVLHAGQVCITLDEGGLVADDTCFGVRVFSENRVPSRMKYLGCLELSGQNKKAPPRPLLGPLEPEEEDNTFDLGWSVPAAGIGSFIIKVTNGEEISYQSVWNAEPDDAGLYHYSYTADGAGSDSLWCFEVRALSTDLQASAWSPRQCGRWEAEPAVNLPWPPVAEPLVQGYVTAFYMETSLDHYPVLVLSADLTAGIDRLGLCSGKIRQCTTTPVFACMADIKSGFEFLECPACATIRANIIADNFIVYRQQSGHDFIQVSPLIESFNCTTENSNEIIDYLLDPFIFLLDIDEAVVGGVSNTDVGSGIRVVFKDRYPFKAGSRLRYKLMKMNRATGEPAQVYTSNWIDVPE